MSLSTDILLEKLIELFINRKKKRDEQETIEIVRIFPKYENRIFETIFEIYREKKLIPKWKKAKKRPNKLEKIKAEIDKEVREYGNYIFQITYRYLSAIEHSIKGIKPLDLLNEHQEHIINNLEGWLDNSPEIDDDPRQTMSWYDIINLVENEFDRFLSTLRQKKNPHIPTLPDDISYWVSKKIQYPKTEEDYFGVVFLYLRFIHFRRKRLVIPLEYLQKIPSHSNALQNEFFAQEKKNALLVFYNYFDILGTDHISRIEILDLMVKLSEDKDQGVRQALTRILGRIRINHSKFKTGVLIDEDFDNYLFEGSSTSLRLFFLENIIPKESQISMVIAGKGNLNFRKLVERLITLSEDNDAKVAQKAQEHLKELRDLKPKYDSLGHYRYLLNKLKEQQLDL